MASHKVNLLDVASTELVSATSGVNDLLRETEESSAASSVSSSLDQLSQDILNVAMTESFVYRDLASLSWSGAGRVRYIPFR